MRINYIDIKIATKNGWIDAKLYNGRPKSETPKSWIEVGLFHHDFGSRYDPNTMKIYKRKDGTFMYEIYRSGSFYPFVGKLECDYLKDHKE